MCKNLNKKFFENFGNFHNKLSFSLNTVIRVTYTILSLCVLLHICTGLDDPCIPMMRLLKILWSLNSHWNDLYNVSWVILEMVLCWSVFSQCTHARFKVTATMFGITHTMHTHTHTHTHTHVHMLAYEVNLIANCSSPPPPLSHVQSVPTVARNKAKWLLQFVSKNGQSLPPRVKVWERRARLVYACM